MLKLPQSSKRKMTKTKRIIGLSVFYCTCHRSLEESWIIIYKNYMVLNVGKCHFMCLGKKTENETLLFNNILIENSKEQKIIGGIIDNNLNFKSQINELCKKASQKIEALSRLPIYLYNSEKKLIFNVIIKSKFSYCPQFTYCLLIWMFFSRTSNSMINKLHEKLIKVILIDYSNNCNILLENNNDICNHHINIQAVLIEVFKMKNELAPPIMVSILNKRFNNYNLREHQEFPTERKKTCLVWS